MRQAHKEAAKMFNPHITPVRRRRYLITGIVLSAALMLSACGSSGSSSASGGQNPAATSGPTASAGLTAEHERSQLKIAMPDLNATEDPIQASNLVDVQIMDLLGGNLFRLSLSGKTAVPSLASSGTYSSNDTVFTVTLRSGAKFSDGTALTSADVVATFHRDLTSKLNIYVGEFQAISSVKADGPDKVTFTFSRPYPSFILLLGNPEMTIVKASEISASGTLPANPVFAGQYTTAKSVVGQTAYVLTRTNYPDPNSTPSVKNLSFTVVTDPNGRLAQVSGGQVDFAQGIDTTNLRSLPSGVKPIAVPAFIFTYLSMNNTSGLTANRNIRKAISLALNRDEISKIAWSGYAQPLGDFFATTMAGYQAGPVTPNIAAAKSLLVGTKCADGCSIPMLAGTSEAWEAPTEVVIQQNLAAIGIKVQIQTVDLATLASRQGSLNYQLLPTYFGASEDVPDATPAYCLQYTAGLGSCFSGFKSTAADQLVTEAERTTNPAGLLPLYHQMNTLYSTDAPYAVMTDYVYTGAVQQEAAGYITLTPGSFFYIAPLDK
jgi:peptide/nickel transport system substrate-binding protein